MLKYHLDNVWENLNNLNKLRNENNQMDNMQIALSQMIHNNQECIINRQTLKAVLMDVLPGKKLEINLILNAYDEGIVEKLQNSSDTTLTALRLIRVLSDEYGLTNNASKWAVVSWCYILGLSEIAKALEEFAVEDNTINSNPTILNKRIIGIGTYKAGFDFKPGDITLKHITKDLQSPGMIKGVTILRGKPIDCYINSSSAIKGAKKICSFTDSCHLEIEDGQYLIIKSDSWANSDMIKIEITEFN